MTTMEVTGLDDSDAKTAKGWKKNFKVTLQGMLNGVTMTLSLKSDDMDVLQEIVPFDKKAQCKLTIEPVNHTLSGFAGNATSGQGQISMAQDPGDRQDEELANLRKDLDEMNSQ